MSQAQLDEMQTLLKQMAEADNYSTVWLTREADLQDKILRLRKVICVDDGHRWEIDTVGNEVVKPRTRAFCIRCGKVKWV